MSVKRWPDEDAPKWLTSRYNNSCAECEAEITEGDRILWDPQTRKTYCKSCGEDITNA